LYQIYYIYLQVGDLQNAVIFVLSYVTECPKSAQLHHQRFSQYLCGFADFLYFLY